MGRIKPLHIRRVVEEVKQRSVAVRDQRRDLQQQYRVQVVQRLGNGPFIRSSIGLPGLQQALNFRRVRMAVLQLAKGHTGTARTIPRTLELAPRSERWGAFSRRRPIFAIRALVHVIPPAGQIPTSALNVPAP